MSVWPLSLPSAPLLEGFSESLLENVLRTPMDQGPAKLRRRTTAGVRRYALAFLLTAAQTQTLDDFFTDTLKDGSLPFDFRDPRTTTTLNLRFLSPPVYQPSGQGYFRVRFEAEALP